MKIYVVKKKYISESGVPINLKVGQEVRCLEESDPNGRWPNWVLCEIESNKGWVPKQIIDRSDDLGVITENYTSIEFDLEVDEFLYSDKELNNWIWCNKENDSSRKAWAPLNHLELHVLSNDKS